jgi:PPK2 family polyphosphate:nucleotide phosphotransferase
MGEALQFDSLRVPPGSAPDLDSRPAAVEALYESKKHYLDLLDGLRSGISDLQRVLYAHDRYALLLVFQGMDSSGKDGVIRHVLSGVNPQGCQVHSFKQPSNEELGHDFPWRTTLRLPERGRIGVFNRSYYEEVLVARVLPEILAKQRLPEDCLKPATIWAERFRDIRNFEDYLVRNGTRVVKFFLHISKAEQRRRLLARIEKPAKNWKFELGDLDMRKNWDDFQRAYAEAIAATSTEAAPWYVVPADDKPNARLIVARVINDTMRGLPMRFPEVDEAARFRLKAARLQLEQEADGGA